MMSSPAHVADIERNQAKDDAAEALRRYQIARDNGDGDLAVQYWAEYLVAVSKSMREAA